MKRILLTIILFLCQPVLIIYAQEYRTGTPWQGEIGVKESTFEIMAREILVGPELAKETEAEKIWPDRSGLPQNPESQSFAYWPPEQNNVIPILPAYDSPQTPGINFTAATLSGINPTLAFPPDCMGAIGPTQYIVAVNGRIVTFNKSTGVADGVLNVTTNTFFNLVRNGSGTSDPRIRYDRLTQRWFIIIINVSTPNRILIAVSDAASNGIISGSTVWTYFFIPINSITPPISNTCLADYPTLGIDANALYIGTNNFCGNPSQTFNSTDGYVVRKSSILGAGPIVVTVFRGLVATSASAGPYTPQGADNFDASSTDGYFIGVDNATFGTLMLRRVTNPGTTPSISTNISISVNTTYFPLTVPHLGNTGGANGNLDALDDRLFAAVIRNGHLWTAHNIGVNNTGIASGTLTRNGSRWYELNNLTGTPTVVQSGTIFQTSVSNTTDQRHYWIPSLTKSGQGHVAMGFSTAGSLERINSATVGRLNNDILGTMGSPLLYTNSSTAYNPPGDPGTRGARRWGDYSFVSVDPNDDMTMWTVQEFCDATNSYGVNVVQLLAPPSATPSSANPNIVANQASVNVTITGTVVNGSGFFDPGAGFPNHISASLSPAGIVVNSTIYNSPTQVTLDLNTSTAVDGFYTVTVTNPDGQSRTSAVAILQVDHNLPVELSSFTAKVLKSGGVKLDWRTETEVNNYGFEVERLQDYNIEKLQEWEKIGFVEGNGNSNSPKDYSFTDDYPEYGSYSYRLKQIDTDGQFEYSKIIEVDAGNIPDGFVLEQNYPNPFNPSTTIKFALAETQAAKLIVYDVLGNEVAIPFDGTAEGGKIYEAEFSGENLSSGIYFYRLVVDSFGETDSKVENRKMLLLK
jgi:hypothetical protein